eukprot:TRINITY_DN5799_c0_g1_i3.p1 TRINITY_DN5799_c0_g1~~TRINITY_DN5799_c0_g1_i3.p1  ORF type:complete len:205 (+),score=41.30 TRINITY_DN5799_c0_g1_i3:52-615(+)
MALCGWALCEGVGVAQDKPRGEEWLLQSNHSMARAWCLLWGFGVAEDQDAAFEVLNTECDTSDPHVQYLLGISHYYGWECVQNDTQAIEWYERAGNHVGALFNLGYLFEHGIGVVRNDARAAVLYRPSAEQGDRDAQYCLARLYEQGKGSTEEHAAGETLVQIGESSRSPRRQNCAATNCTHVTQVC